MKTFQISYIFLFSLLVLNSCKKDDPTIPNEEEVITTLSYTLTASDGKTTTLLFQDKDGDGGEAPTIQSGSLKSNTTYSGVISLKNEQAKPVEEVTEEVLEEADEHQFFFQTTIAGLTVDYADKDANGLPLGVKTTVKTGEPGKGTLTITLRHQPNKKGENVSKGEIKNAGGETDIEVTFNVDVE